jgi:hypothetical protein
VRAVAQAHDRAVLQPGGDFQAGGQRGAFDDQRMIARGLEGRGQAAEHALSLVVHGAHLAVHDLAGAHHLAAEGLADGLVAEAHAQKRHAGTRLRRVSGMQMPACAGSQGPGDSTMASGAIAITSCTCSASLRTTLTSAPSSPR